MSFEVCVSFKVIHTMSVFQLLPLYNPPISAPETTVQVQHVAPPPRMVCHVAPPVKQQQRTPERLQDYAGPMAIFAPVMSTAVYLASKKQHHKGIML